MLGNEWVSALEEEMGEQDELPSEERLGSNPSILEWMVSQAIVVAVQGSWLVRWLRVDVEVQEEKQNTEKGTRERGRKESRESRNYTD